MRTRLLQTSLTLAMVAALAACGSATNTSVDNTANTTKTTTTPAQSSTSPEDRCHTSELTPALDSTDGAAGTTYYTISLTNTGTRTCTLYGYPGVSLIADTQIGAPAQRLTDTPEKIIALAPSDSAHFTLGVEQAGKYSCQTLNATGFRIYPPDEKDPLDLQQPGLTGCQDDTPLLTVQAVTQ